MLHFKDNFTRLYTKALSMAMYIALFSTLSCINNIPGKDEILTPGEVPISLSTIVKANTRITDNGFEENEAFGVYVMVQPSTVEGTRYVDNMKIIYTASEGCTPQETIFYPEGNNKCDFIGYYPYQNNAINKGTGQIKVEVETDQSSKKAISASDFLTAETKGITASEKPVTLAFNHKLFKLNIYLNVLSGYTPETLLAANPTVKIKDVYTKGTYDFAKDEFSELNTKTDIIPHGTWKIEDDMICGKSAIIIPQTLSQSHILIELDVEGRLFECELEDVHTLSSGVAENNTITLTSSEDATKNILTTTIAEWITREKDITGKEVSTGIDISTLSYTKSYVHRVFNKETQVAEICKEYLYAENIETQAIVIYSVVDGKTDLSNGIVARLIETDDTPLEGSIHGGSVSWDAVNSTLTYTKGTSEAINYIYISADGEIKTTRPNNALQLKLKPDILSDARGTSIIEYPIVKVGTQYWMRGNLKTSKYTDGTNIELGGSTVATKAQYYIYENAYYFYNAAAITNKKLIPDGWRIGSETDFEQLKSYVNNNAAVIKGGTSWEKSNYPITNLTGFNCAGTGYFDKTHTGIFTYASYWCSENTNPDIVTKRFIVNVNSNTLTTSTITSDMALAIRCIRN